MLSGNSMEILKAGLLTSIQDMGRPGLAYYAIPPSGAMDKYAARIAQLLFHQTPDTPLIECTAIAPQIRFNAPTQIAISGADFGWTLNANPIVLNNIIELRSGDILSGKMATEGLRGYIVVNGKLKLDKVYGSYATYANAQIGGYQGRLLRKGDILEWEPASMASTLEKLIPIQPGPEFDYLSGKSQQLLIEQEYTIGMDSNRMGLRLEGIPLESRSYQLAHSLPVLPGFIQLPPSGLPIIILQDGQTSGGYPRIAYVRGKDLAALNQIPLGGRFRFDWG